MTANFLSWNGNSFSAVVDYQLGDYYYKGNITGTLSADGNWVSSITGKMELTANNSDTESYTFEGKNIPLNYNGESESWTCGKTYETFIYTYRVQGAAVKDHVVSFSYTSTNYFSDGDIMHSSTSISADYNSSEHTPEVEVSFSYLKE